MNFTKNKLKLFKNAFAKTLVLIIFFLVFIQMLGAPASSHMSVKEMRVTQEQYEKDLLEQYRIENQRRYDTATFLLQLEVDKYIKKYSKGSRIKADKLVQISDLYKLDIKLVLAQGHLESNFGTKGKAKKTNSVFNVGTFDNGVVLYRYKNPNESIEPYAKLITDRYKANKKTEADLLIHRQFKDINGKRYATAKNYERNLNLLILKINNETIIDSLQHMRYLTGLVPNINNNDSTQRKF